jgi:hypothetical protein
MPEVAPIIIIFFMKYNILCLPAKVRVGNK